MKFFDAIEGQEAAIGALLQMLAMGRVPSALLFLGPHHVGKRTTALALAKALNCAGGGGGLESGGADCGGTCPSCRKIDEGVHPDVEVIAPDGQFIKIDQVRGVTDMLGLVPFEARKRVIILSQAERMNPPAANAFLKTLEEPPVNTLIVLCASSTSELFDTIISRCLPLRFGLLREPALRGLLSGNPSGKPGGQASRSAGASKKLEGEVLEFAVRFARGRLRPELRERGAQWMALREELIEGWSRLDAGGFVEMSQKFAKWSGTEDWRFVLEWLETWYHDLALLGDGATEMSLINGDRPTALREWSARFPPATASTIALACYRRVLEARAASRLNVNKQLGLEGLWLGCKALAQERHKEVAA